MGIPRLVKTLMTRYPLIVGNIRNSSDIPKIDYLYLDLNSVIHELSHSNQDNILSLLKLKTKKEIFEQTCETINQILELIKPSSLLMIALDGVSPIAKINNQLKHRHTRTCIKYNNIFDGLFKALDLIDINYFNSNDISPCTNFMIEFENYLDNYIQQKLRENNNNIWKKISIILSGSNVPGEGEYKIMEHIRENKDKNKNCKYCIFSGDADFILLSLLVHESNIVILKKSNSIKTKNTYNFDFNKENNSLFFNEFIYISVLREYLDIEFCKLKSKIKFSYNIERIYDDYVLLLLLLGNDFIPGLMNLDSDGNVYESILNSYKNSIIKCKDYLTKDGIINFNSFKIFINELSLHENEYLNNKYDFFKRIYLSKKNNNNSESLLELFNQTKFDENNNNLSSYDKLKYAMNSNEKFMKKIVNMIDNEIMSNVKEYGKDLTDYFFHKFIEQYNLDRFKARNLYYQDKFHINLEDNKEKKILNEIITNYIEGLQWNLYYYKGYLIWNWNYMCDFPPLITDLAKYDYKDDLNETINKDLEKYVGEPLPPYISLALIISDNDYNIPENYYDIVYIIPQFFNFTYEFDSNGIPFPSQIIMTTPKIKGKEMFNKLIEFDKNEFPKTENYHKIKDNYNKEFIYSLNNDNAIIKKEYKHGRKNEIMKELYESKKIDIEFPSLESIIDYKYIEGYFMRNVGKNKIIQIISLFIYISLDEKKYKKINKPLIDNILKNRIISYGYPLIKLGILTGVYYNNRHYSIKNEEKSYLIDYEELIKKDYEFIGLKILNPSLLIELIPILSLNEDKYELDYEFKYIIPFEITSLNINNKTHQEFLKINKINEDLIKDIDIIIDKVKDKDIFIYDKSWRKSKDNNNKEKNKIFKDKKDKKRKKPKGPPLIEREISNFKFMTFGDLYY